LLAQLDHRPWELPRRPWIMMQTWRNLLFAHWRVPAEMIEPHLPPSLTLDTFEGEAWLGVVPFHMTGIRPRWLPPIPGTAAFVELNVRTYVTAGGKAGVWFFSLDATRWLAVEAARTFYHLPYFKAAMSVQLDGDAVQYHSERTDRRADSGLFEGTYQPTGAVYASQPGTLDHWLTERYCLYAAAGKRLFRGEIHHLPWPLQPAAADIHVNTVVDAHGLALPDEMPLLHYAGRLDVLIWNVEAVR
jgi:hypothetical protein